MKNSEIANIFRVSGVYTASVIGAGFASGQELVRFFLKHGALSFAGILLAGLLFSILGYIVLDRVYMQRIRNYDEFIIPMVGRPLGMAVDLGSTLFTLSVFCIMIAGSGSIAADALNIPLHLGVSLMALLCMVVLIADLKGVVTLSAFVTPILIIGMAIVSLYIICSMEASAFKPEVVLSGVTRNWVVSAVIYVSYNSIMSLVVLCSLLPYLNSRRVGRLGGIFGGVILGAAALMISTALFYFHPEISGKDFPLLEVIKPYSSFLSIAYTVVLWLAMALSAVTAGFCVTSKVSRRIRCNHKYISPVICILAVPLSAVGFSRLIGTIYPLFGCIGLFMLLVIFLYGIKDFIGRRKNSD